MLFFHYDDLDPELRNYLTNITLDELFYGIGDNHIVTDHPDEPGEQRFICSTKPAD